MSRDDPIVDRRPSTALAVEVATGRVNQLLDTSGTVTLVAE